MSSKIVNVTYQIVNQKIEEVLLNPTSPYESAFTNPKLRQKLIVRILNHVSPHYTFYEEAGINITSPENVSLSAEEERQIERMIQENVIPILREEDALQYFHPHSPASYSKDPSHWFG